MQFHAGEPSCGQYNREHDWQEKIQHEERAVLVITHGPRAGRIYAVDQSWSERTCKRCDWTQKIEGERQGSEWPGGI